MQKPDSDTLERMRLRKSIERINRRRKRCGENPIPTDREEVEEDNRTDAEDELRTEAKSQGQFRIRLQGLDVSGKWSFAVGIVLIGTALVVLAQMLARLLE